MTGALIGFLTSAAVIAFSQINRKMDLRLFASLNLAVIPFIYIGFSIDPYTLLLTTPSAALFVFLAYQGYKVNHLFIVAGLALHGLWDIIFPFLSTVAPHGYDLFCITIDLLLALYFYVKLKPSQRRTVFGRI